MLKEFAVSVGVSACPPFTCSPQPHYYEVVSGEEQTIESLLSAGDQDHGFEFVAPCQERDIPREDATFLWIDGKLRIDANLMRTHKPYPFEFGDWWFVAVKQTNGDINFYYISDALDS